MKITTFLKEEIKIDKKLLKKITKYKLLWANKNVTRINFLSSPHIGVEPIRFLTKEEEDFFDLVLGLDMDYARKSMHAMDGVHGDWAVGGYVTYLTCVGLMSAIKDDPYLKSKQKEQAFNDLFSIMAYRFITSMIVNGFDFDLNIDLAESVFESMSKRFLIKRLGSWNALINYRAKDFQDKGIYNIRLVNADNEAITKLIAAIRTRIADHIKEQYDVIVKVLERQEKRLSTSITKEGEDGEYIMDTANLNREYFNYAQSVVPIRSEFIDKDILSIVSDVYNRVNSKEFLKVLNYMSDNYLSIKNIDKIISSVLKANVDYIYGNKLYPPYHNRILQVIMFNKGLWSSSRVKDSNVMYAKKELSVIVEKATRKKTEWLVTPIVLAVAMYIFVKTVIGHKK